MSAIGQDGREASAAEVTLEEFEPRVRDRMRGADLEILGERGGGTAEHWVVARRR